MDPYAKTVVAFTVGTAALLGDALGRVLPAGVAAVMAMLVASAVVSRLDKVRNAFKTDVERVLQPDKAFMERLVMLCVPLGVGVAWFAAGTSGAAMGAALGLVAMLLVVAREIS